MRLCITDYSAEKITYHKVHKSVDSLHYEKACIGYLLQGSAEYLCEGMPHSRCRMRVESRSGFSVPSICSAQWRSAFNPIW